MIIHIKNDPPVKSLKRLSLSGAEGSAIELIESMGVGWGSAPLTHPINVIREIWNGSIISRSILKILQRLEAQ
jgi:hypothetical protein